MAVKIRTGAKRSTRSKPKATEPEAKKTTRTRSTGAKSTAKAKTATKPARKAPAAKKTAAKPKSSTATRRSSKPQVDQRTLDRHLKAMERTGAKREATKEKWEEAVKATHEAALEALDAGVPMSMVSEATGISRQWLYKLIEQAQGSTNGKGTKTEAKSAVKSAKRGSGSTRKAAVKSPKATSNAKPTGRKTTTRKAAGRTRIRAGK